MLLQELERLAPSAKASMVLPLAEMSNQLICVYRFIAEDAEKALANGQLLEDLANAHDEIINIFDTLAASQTVNPNPKLVERLREWGGSPVVNLPTESSYVPVSLVRCYANVFSICVIVHTFIFSFLSVVAMTRRLLVTSALPYANGPIH